MNQEPSNYLLLTHSKTSQKAGLLTEAGSDNTRFFLGAEVATRILINLAAAILRLRNSENGTN